MPESYRPVVLSCQHRITCVQLDSRPPVGEMLFCRICGKVVPITFVGDMWKLVCKDCSFRRINESRGGARALAHSHMLRRRHHVMIFDMSQSVETTLEVFQIATDLQMVLGDEPPF